LNTPKKKEAYSGKYNPYDYKGIKPELEISCLAWPEYIRQSGEGILIGQWPRAGR